MKSIQANFKRIQKQNPMLGEYPVLLGAVRYKKYTRRTLRKNIYLLGDEFDESTIKQLVEHLHSESQKAPEECKNEGKKSRDSLLEE